MLSVGHRTGLRAISHGSLSRGRSDFPGCVGSIAPRGVLLSRLLAELRRPSDARGRRRHRRRARRRSSSCPSTSVGALSVISRGLAPSARVALGVDLHARPRLASRARTSAATSPAGSTSIARSREEVVRRVREERPDFVFAALTGVDKMSHAAGHDSPIDRSTRSRIVDDAAARIRDDAERAGAGTTCTLWIVSDHGHSRVSLARRSRRRDRALGLRMMSHPWIFTLAPQVGGDGERQRDGALYVRRSSAASAVAGARCDRAGSRSRELLLARPVRRSARCCLATIAWLSDGPIASTRFGDGRANGGRALQLSAARGRSARHRRAICAASTPTTRTRPRSTPTIRTASCRS